jgi:hypothetical protein
LVADPKAAFREHTRYYQRVLSCVSSNAHVLYKPHFPEGTEALIAVSPNPLPLTTRSGHRLLLHLKLSAQLDASWQEAHCSRYSIQIHDSQDSELAAWHSGHGGTDAHSVPHIHVAVPHGLLHKRNLPTSFVALADILYLLLDQLAVVPQRADWREVLRTPLKLDR